MTLHAPFQISPRLLPGLRIGGAWVQLEYARRAGNNGRMRYRYTIDLPDGSGHEGDDLQSGCFGGGSLQRGFEDLLAFLSAAAKGGENADLFPPAIVAWAKEFDDDISMTQCELEANDHLIEE